MKLNQIVGIAKLFSDRKIPVDVEKFLEDEYYSSSKQKNVKYGDMDLFHYIRVNIKDHKELWKRWNEENEKLYKIKKILEDEWVIK